MDFYSPSSLKQQSTGIHFAPLRHIILIMDQPGYDLSPQYCVLSAEATNTNFRVFGLIRPSKPQSTALQGEQAYHYTMVAVLTNRDPTIFAKHL